MKIYSMTATFGKLEHETITLKPGLNVIYAPNEWGKSTWCAFLLAMLYGMETRSKSTKTALADKERFAPWSGAPMSGRIELNWEGRDITIERSTHGRIPLGFFRAFETSTGLDIPELNAANCGQKLLGVEQSVFRRAGFIRFTDLPITDDRAFRARLNALVTTGDESGDGIRLEKELRDAKNKIQYNRSGLLPQAEADRDSLQRRLREYEDLSNEQTKLTQELDNQAERQQALENHLRALACRTAKANAEKVSEAKAAMEASELQVMQWEAEVCRLPSAEEAAARLEELKKFRDALDEAEAELADCPLPPVMPEIPKVFQGMSPEEASDKVHTDTLNYQKLSGNQWFGMILCAGLLTGLAAYLLWVLNNLLAAALILGVLGILLYTFLVRRESRLTQCAQLEKLYGSANPDNWLRQCRRYTEILTAYEDALRKYHADRAKLDSQLDALRKQQAGLCGESTVNQMLANWQQVLSARTALENARQNAQKAKEQYTILLSMAKPVPEAPCPDNLIYTAEETQRILRSCNASQQNIRLRLGQLQGRMSMLGNQAQMTEQLQVLLDRIQKLEDTYAALELAQKTLAKASAELQRKFAPRISGRAKELMMSLTGGRYDRLALGEDFTLRAAAADENILHDTLWRSDGTVDQLYLALRLAVAETLTPEAPLILDDALVRFDELRLEAAMTILKQMSHNKQVILFTCQQRETAYQEEA